MLHFVPKMRTNCNWRELVVCFVILIWQKTAFSARNCVCSTATTLVGAIPPIAVQNVSIVAPAIAVVAIATNATVITGAVTGWFERPLTSPPKCQDQRLVAGKFSGATWMFSHRWGGSRLNSDSHLLLRACCLRFSFAWMKQEAQQAQSCTNFGPIFHRKNGATSMMRG